MRTNRPQESITLLRAAGTRHHRTAPSLGSARSNPPLPPIPSLSANISTSPHQLLPGGCFSSRGWQGLFGEMAGRKKKQNPTLQGKGFLPSARYCKACWKPNNSANCFLSLSPFGVLYTHNFPCSPAPPPALPHPHADVRQQQASSPWLIAGSAAHSGSQLPHEK